MVEFISQSIPEVKLLQLNRFSDSRGFFGEVFRADQFKDLGMPTFVQDNMSLSHSLVFRGLHYQLNPHPQAKLVSCLKGRILDFAVDIRKGSPTYGRYVAVVLSAEEPKMLYIPEGFAHGFLVLSVEDALVYYKTSNYYSKECDRCIRWTDPDISLSINWCNQWNAKIYTSEKDAQAPLLKDAENNFEYVALR